MHPVWRPTQSSQNARRPSSGALLQLCLLCLQGFCLGLLSCAYNKACFAELPERQTPLP